MEKVLVSFANKLQRNGINIEPTEQYPIVNKSQVRLPINSYPRSFRNQSIRS